MKKLLAIVMTVAMVLSMSVIASADQTATVSYDGSTATITVNTTEFSSFDLGVYAKDLAPKGIVWAPAYKTDVQINDAYLVSGALNPAASDSKGQVYASAAGAGTINKGYENEGGAIPYNGALVVVTFENVPEGTEFVLVTGASEAINTSGDITQATVAAKVTAAAATEEPTTAPTAEATTAPTPDTSDKKDDTVVDDKKDDTTTDDKKNEVVTTTKPSNTGKANAGKTADVAPVATMISLVVVAGVAIVALKKKATN